MEEIFLIILSFILAIVGIAGAIYPIIPGAIISFSALLLFYFATGDKISVTTLVIWGVIVSVASLLDAIIPPLITKRMGGSKRAVTGSLVGTIIGSFFFPPFGMLLGSFMGALIGQWQESRSFNDKSFRVAMGSFLGFILGTGLKLMVSISILVALIFELI